MIGALAALEEVRIPNTVGWACAPTYRKLEDYVIPAIKQFIPKEWFEKKICVEHIDRKELVFAWGSLIQFRSLDSPDAGRGPGLDWCWIDEVCEVSEKTWQVLRPALTERRGVAWFTTSPRGFDWCYSRFWQPAAEQRPGYWAVKYKTSENPTIDQRELDAARYEMSDQMYRQEYEADFVTFEGAIYKIAPECVLTTEAQMKQLIPEWPKLNPDRQVVVGLDPGADHPFAAVALVLTEQGVVAIWEYRERQRAVVEHANALRLATAHWHPRYVIDKTQLQTQLELTQHGIIAQPAMGGPNSVRPGIDRVSAWLEKKRFFLYQPAVPRLLEEMMSYRWKDTSNQLGEKGKEQPLKINDDLCDAVRYAFMSWPSLPKIPEPQYPLGRDLKANPIPPGMEATWARLVRLKEQDDGLIPVTDQMFLTGGTTFDDADEPLRDMGAVGSML